MHARGVEQQTCYSNSYTFKKHTLYKVNLELIRYTLIPKDQGCFWRYCLTLGLMIVNVIFASSSSQFYGAYKHEPGLWGKMSYVNWTNGCRFLNS
jgi:hypothetical protein